MLKHLPEGLTPFADCGFARAPEYPLAGEPVRVDCRTDETEPTLTLRLADGERTLAPAKGREADGHRYWSFELGALQAGESAAYRIQADGEASRWFPVAAHTEQIITKPIAALRDGNALALLLADDVALLLAGGDALDMRLVRTGVRAAGESIEQAALALPDGFSVAVSPERLWTLTKAGAPVVACERYRLLRDPSGAVVRVEMRAALRCAHVLGTGERFDSVERLGRSGDGRVTEKFTHQGDQTYLPMPFFFTDAGFGWHRVSDIPAAFSFRDGLCIAQETEGDALTRDRVFFGAPQGVLRAYVQSTGEAVLPPDWAFGVWLSGNGWHCDADVDEQLAALRRYDYPASVLVLEAWSDERTFHRFSDLWDDPAAMVRRVREAGLHLVLWQIPVVKHEGEGAPGEALERDTREAVEGGYLVQKADGSPYRITELWFNHSMLPDFTNPDACAWWFSKREHLLRMGVEGFKTDGGEFLFDKTARLHDGTSGLRAHNLYAGQYAGAYQRFLRAHGVHGVTFSRAGYAGAQTCPLHWAGDQLSEWSELQSQLRAGISAGLSGVLFWGFDIGGFAGALPSAELYLRATALGCFSPVMQWHAEPRGGQFGGAPGEGFNNDRSPWNLAEKLGDESLLTIACAYARLRERLMPYLIAEARHCVEAARPMMAHLCLDNPDDPRAWNTHDEFMLGRRLLVAPVVDEGRSERSVYLPQGTWRHFFTGEIAQGPCERTVACPLTSVPVWEKQ